MAHLDEDVAFSVSGEVLAVVVQPVAGDAVNHISQTLFYIVEGVDGEGIFEGGLEVFGVRSASVQGRSP